MKDCPFCTDNDVLARVCIENDLARAFPTNIPIVPWHMLVCPKRHVQYADDLTKEEWVAIETLRKAVRTGLQTVCGAEGFNYAWNEEAVGGQSVPHFHLHIVPRKEGDAGVHGYEPRECLYRPSAREVTTPEEVLRDVSQKLREAIV
jgi:diadenosine tetraphosphate (Ap4A) HIT family hydrolase